MLQPMETVLNQQQQELLKLTRNTLGRLRDTLADGQSTYGRTRGPG